MGTLSVDKLVKTSSGAAEFTLPATDGTAGQVLQTDGSGQLSVAALAADTVTATQIAANAVTSSEIADDAVTSAKLANTLNITSGNSLTIDSGATITNSGTATGFVTDGSVTVAKLSTSATESDNVKQRVAKAWINYNASTAAITDDFNVSSITDVGTGIFTITLSTAMSSSSYVVAGTVGNSSKGVISVEITDSSNFKANSREANTATYTDYSNCCVTVFGDGGT